MPANHLETLIAEWYDWQGYFVRRNVHVGPRPRGGYDCELDVVAYDPDRKRVVHIEPSLDADSWSKREVRYRRKFDAGRTHIPRLFSGLEITGPIDQQAIFLFAGRTSRSTIGGGRIVQFEQFMQEILNTVRRRGLASAMISEQFPLLRTLQFAAQAWPVGAACGPRRVHRRAGLG